MKVFAIAALILTTLTGCFVKGDDVLFTGSTPVGYEQLNIGVPFLIGASATGVQYKKGVGVTVKHNSIVIPDLLWEHPTHDIAFFKLDNDVPKWADAKVGDKVTAYGNSALRQNRILVTVVTYENWYWTEKTDLIHVTKGGITSGMSGGPIYNAAGAAVGIMNATISSNIPENYSVYGSIFKGNGLFVPNSEIHEAWEQMCKEINCNEFQGKGS